MKRRTKIVCTLGPASGSRERIGELIRAGMNVARINCSHGDWETRKEWIQHIREQSSAISPVGILVDLQGPKFRIGPVPGGAIEVKAGDTLTIGKDLGATLHVPGKEICDAMETGARVLMGDGEVELKLGAEKDGTFEAKVITGGTVKSKQGVTLVNKVFNVDALSEKDLEDVRWAALVGADIVALSYVNRASDLRELRRLLDRYGSKALLCAKIETKQAVKEIDEILKVADIIMVARGDLGLQMDLELIPITQKELIRKSNKAGRPVITATQMLESMLKNARPTRAEATDVANAILDGTDAVMLSGETAAGDYPIEAVKTMARIAETAESAFNYDLYFDQMEALGDMTSAVAEAAVQLASRLKVKAILCTSTSGHTARMVSKFRPKTPILCTAWSPEAHTQLSPVWGVETISLPSPNSTDDVVQLAIDGFLKAKRLKVGDRVVIVAGVPAGQPGHTNLIWVETVR